MPKRDSDHMEHKSFPAVVTKVEGDQGVVEHIVAVTGNVDLGLDRIEPGAFVKTLVERGNSIRVLDQHNTDSIMRVLGKPLSMREVGRKELPSELLNRFPEAKGGLWARTQFLLQTPEGKGAFERIKSGAVSEFSIGYDAVDTGFEQVSVNGKQVPIRSIKQIKLYEYSPVLWGMNPATQTISAKADEGRQGARAFKAAEMNTHQAELTTKALWDAGNRTADAFHDAIDTILADESLEGAVKLSMISDSCAQFGQAIGDWAARVIAVSGKSAGEPAECKAGRRHSSATRAAIQTAIKVLNDLIEEASEQDACDPDDERKPRKEDEKSTDVDMPVEPAPSETQDTAGGDSAKAGPDATPPTAEAAAGPGDDPPTSSQSGDPVLADLDREMEAIRTVLLEAAQ